MGTVANSKCYPCPDSKCGSSDGVKLFMDGTYFCFVCQRKFKELEMPTQVTTMAQPVSATASPLARFSEIGTLQMRGFQERGITKVVAEHYKVRVSYTAKGAFAAHYYPYDGGKRYKARLLPKTFSWIANGPDKGSSSLFGIERFNNSGKRVIITEGELDALAIAQASYDRYGVFHPILSVASSSNLKGLITHREWLRTFQEIVLAFDMDSAGEEAVEKALTILGMDKTKIAMLPHNDPCETFIQEGGATLMKCIFNAAVHIPQGIVTRDELWEKLQAAEDAPGIDFPPCLAGVATKLKKIRQGEITLLVSGTGCHKKGTGIMLSDGRIKDVEHIVEGDQVMDERGNSQAVIALHRGRSAMARVDMSDGTSFVVNKEHQLTCVNIKEDLGFDFGDTLDIKVRHILRMSKKFQAQLKLYRIGALPFKRRDTLLHPYLLGTWLGTERKEVVSFNRARGCGLVQDVFAQSGFSTQRVNSRLWTVDQPFEDTLKALRVWDNPHIPVEYRLGSVKDRKRLLAGLIDISGKYSARDRRYELYFKDRILRKEIIFVCRSLGYTVVAKGNMVAFHGIRYQEIPVVLAHRRAEKRVDSSHQPDWFSFTLTILPEDDYYGFTLDGDGRFVMSNFVVTHNSGKSTVLREIMLHVLETTTDKIGIVSLEESPDATARSLSYMALHKNRTVEELSLEQLKPGFDEVFGSDRVMVLDHQGSLDHSITDKLEYMALTGCHWLFIDHITLLVSEGVEDLQGNEAQDQMMNDLRRLVTKHRVWVGLVSQLRKTGGGDKGKSFEEGRMPSLDSIKGSGSIKQISFDVIAFARDMGEADDTLRNTIRMSVLKARVTGLTGPVDGALYHYPTGRLKPLSTVPDEGFVIEGSATRIDDGVLTDEESEGSGI